MESLEQDFKWKKLDGTEGMPTDDMYAVLLFPLKTACGVSYTVSNPVYARGQYAKEAGYTHWAELTLCPGDTKWEEL